MTQFTEFQPTLENHWRSVILFGRNVATYNYALGKSLLDLSQKGNEIVALARALLANGVCYLSFKEGEGERAQGERRFTDFTTSSLEACLARHPEFEIVRIWMTDDVRPDRTHAWVNALVRKESD